MILEPLPGMLIISTIQASNGLFQYNRFCIYYPDNNATTIWRFVNGTWNINIISGLWSSSLDDWNCTINFTTFFISTTMYIKCDPTTNTPGLSQQLRYKTLVC